MKKITYRIGDDVLKVIQNLLYEAHKGDFSGPDSTEEFYIETGMAGIMGMNSAIKEMTLRSGLVINASDIPASSSITSYIIPFLAKIHFIVDPTFDTLSDKVPYIKGFKQTSYNFRIKDSEQQVIAEIIAKKPYKTIVKFLIGILKFFKLIKA